MKLKIFLAILPAVFYLMSVSSTTVAGEIKCPQSITELPTVSTSDKQWAVVTNAGERSLEQVGIYLGTLSEYGSQVPDSTKKAKNKEHITWIITRAPTDTFWVGCSYVGTTAMLFQKLDSRIKACVASYDLLASGKRQRLSTFDCN